MNEIMVESFFNELEKIAQNNELEETQPISDEDATRRRHLQKIKNIGAIVAGVAAGELASEGVGYGLKRYLDSQGKSLPKWAPLVTRAALLPALGAGARLLHSQMDEQDQNLLRDAERGK